MSRREEPTVARARVGWGVGDQALSSLTNFILGVFVARAVSATEFGAFGLGYSIFIIAVGISRAATSDSLMARFSTSGHSNWQRGIASATGTSIVIGFLASTALLSVGLVTDNPTRFMCFALALTMPGLLLQDGWRYGFVVAGRVRRAFATDLACLTLMAPLFLALGASGHTSAGSYVLAWGGVASVVGAVASLAEHVAPDATSALRWLREQRDLAAPYVGEFIAVNGALQITMFLLVVIAGLAAVGSLRAGFLLFGPILVLFQGSLLVLIPEGVRILPRGLAFFRLTVIALGAILVGVTLAWGLLVILLPAHYGEALLGNSWAGAHNLAIPLTVMFAASGAETAAVVGLRAMAAARQSLRARLIETGLTIVGGALGASIAGTKGAAWGLAIAFWIEVAVWFWQFGRAQADTTAPEPSRRGATDEPLRDEPIV